MNPLIIAALISGAVGLISTIIDNSVNYSISQDNKKSQEDLLDYQKSVQSETWNREDNAMQRTMADYEKAGVNPLLAIGNPYSSTGVVSGMSAPTSSFKSNFGSFANSLSKLSSDTYMNRLEEDVKKNQIKLIQEQTKGVTTSNAERELALEIARYNFDYYRKNGLPTNATGIPKQFSEGMSMIEDKFFKDGISVESVGNFGKWLFTPNQYSLLGMPIRTSETDNRSLFQRGLDGVKKLRDSWKSRRNRAHANYIKQYNVEVKK